MKVMISQPMRGKTEKQIRDERKELIEMLEDNDDVQNVYSNFEVADEIADKLQ